MMAARLIKHYEDLTRRSQEFNQKEINKFKSCETLSGKKKMSDNRASLYVPSSSTLSRKRVDEKPFSSAFYKRMNKSIEKFETDIYFQSNVDSNPEIMIRSVSLEECRREAIEMKEEYEFTLVHGLDSDHDSASDITNESQSSRNPKPVVIGIVEKKGRAIVRRRVAGRKKGNATGRETYSLQEFKNLQGCIDTPDLFLTSSHERLFVKFGQGIVETNRAYHRSYTILEIDIDEGGKDTDETDDGDTEASEETNGSVEQIQPDEKFKGNITVEKKRQPIVRRRVAGRKKGNATGRETYSLQEFKNLQGYNDTPDLFLTSSHERLSLKFGQGIVETNRAYHRSYTILEIDINEGGKDTNETHAGETEASEETNDSVEQIKPDEKFKENITVVPNADSSTEESSNIPSPNSVDGYAVAKSKTFSLRENIPKIVQDKPEKATARRSLQNGDIDVQEHSRNQVRIHTRNSLRLGSTKAFKEAFKNLWNHKHVK